jgi:hypothetical protein
MANAFEIPLCTPLRFFQQTDITGVIPSNDIDLGGFDINYNSRPFDNDFFVRLLKDWEDKVVYIQKFQRGDDIVIYWHTVNDKADYSINILDDKGTIYTTIASASISETTVGSVKAMYYTLPAYDLADGKYFAQIKFNRPGLSSLIGEDLYMISEPFEVREEWEDTILLEYTHSSNDQNVLFKATGLKFNIRINGTITELLPQAKVEVYENQPLDQVLLSGKPYRELTLYVGSDRGLVPDWIVDKINRTLCCDSLRIDDTYYSRTDEGGLEVNRTKNHPLAQWSIDLRERYNKDSVEVDGSSSVDYSFGQMPKAKRFYVQKLTVSGASVSVERDFSSKNGFLAYLDNYFTNTQSLSGKFYLNSENEIIYQPGDSNDQAWLTSNNPSIGGILNNYLALTIDTNNTPTLEFTSGTLQNDAVYWGDGTAHRNYGNTGGTHAYTAQGDVTCYYYFNDQIDLTASTTTGDGIIGLIGGDITTTLTDLEIINENLNYVDNSLLLLGVGTFNLLNLEGNSLPVAQINKILIMLLDAVNENKATSSGSAILNLQSPLAPPSGGSMATVVSQLRSYWTLTLDT